MVKKSTVVVFWHPGYSNKVPLPAGVMYHRVPPFFKFYDVWNVEQTQGLEAHIPAGAAREFVPIERAEKIAAGMAEQPRIKCKGESALYFSVADTIWMPPQEHFQPPEEYYSTLFHELVHSTGHSSRLNRKSLYKVAEQGDHAYSFEELVAEIGAAMLCGLAGIAPVTLDNSAAYIASWLHRLKDDKTWVLHAAAQAQKATDRVVGTNPKCEGQCTMAIAGAP